MARTCWSAIEELKHESANLILSPDYVAGMHCWFNLFNRPCCFQSHNYSGTRKAAAAARSRPLSAVCRWDHRSPPTLCSEGRGFSRWPAEGLSLCHDWQTWIKYHPTGLSDWWMTIDYKNVLGKWRFMIGGRDQKGRVFPANPELDNSRDLDSGFCFFRFDRPCSGPAENNPRKA